MANYKSIFTGQQVDNVIGLFSERNLDSVTNAIVYRKSDGDFEAADSSILDIWYDTTNQLLKKRINGQESNILSITDLYRDIGAVSNISYNSGTLTQTKYNGDTTIFTISNLETDLKKGAANGIAPLNGSGQLDSSYATWAATKATTVTDVSYGNKKLTQIINGTTSDIVSISTIATDLGKGVANGIAPLNASGLIDASFLPSYVDDVLEYNGLNNFPAEGESGKIYVDTSTNLTYRWSGSTYVEISPGTVVTVTPSLTTGTKSATIGINGTAYDIYSETNTDEKLALTSLDISQSTTTYPILGSGNSAATRQIDTTGITYEVDSNDHVLLTLGSITPTREGGSQIRVGTLRLFNSNGYSQLIVPNTNATANSSVSLPTTNGTLALISDIPDISTKQDVLVSGTNIKTINNESILGSGNITIQGGSSSGIPYIIAWDGESAPDATKIPRGVTVQYEGVSYSGGLLASNAQAGTLYLIKSDNASPVGVNTGFNEYLPIEVTLASIGDSPITSYEWELVGGSSGASVSAQIIRW